MKNKNSLGFTQMNSKIRVWQEMKNNLNPMIKMNPMMKLENNKIFKMINKWIKMSKTIQIKVSNTSSLTKENGNGQNL